jgi:hypothetical protein
MKRTDIKKMESKVRPRFYLRRQARRVLRLENLPSMTKVSESDFPEIERQLKRRINVTLLLRGRKDPIALESRRAGGFGGNAIDALADLKWRPESPRFPAQIEAIPYHHRLDGANEFLPSRRIMDNAKVVGTVSQRQVWAARPRDLFATTHSCQHGFDKGLRELLNGYEEAYIIKR